MISEQVERELLQLDATERLRVAHWLLDSLLTEPQDEIVNAQTTESDNPLLRIAGRFSGGPGDSAERIEEILEAEVDPIHGLGIRNYAMTYSVTPPFSQLHYTPLEKRTCTTEHPFC